MTMTMMMREAVRRLARGAAVLGVGLMLWTGAAGVATAQTPPASPQAPGAAQDEFVPIDQLPPQDKLPAGQFLIAAYSLVWLGMSFYVWTVWKRLGRVEQELARVAGPAAGRGRDAAGRGR